jgi:hypothetical protein
MDRFRRVIHLIDGSCFAFEEPRYTVTTKQFFNCAEGAIIVTDNMDDCDYTFPLHSVIYTTNRVIGEDIDEVDDN